MVLQTGRLSIGTTTLSIMTVGLTFKDATLKITITMLIMGGAVMLSDVFFNVMTVCPSKHLILSKKTNILIIGVIMLSVILFDVIMLIVGTVVLSIVFFIKKVDLTLKM